MATEMDLMQRLAVSKKIMEKTEQIKRGDVRPTNTMVEDFQPVSGVYNLPEELLSETKTQNYHDPTKAVDQERILNSKLPDEIKRLMIEQPIVQPSGINGGTVLSDDIIEGATRLMKKDKISDFPQTQKPKQKMYQKLKHSYG